MNPANGSGPDAAAVPYLRMALNNAWANATLHNAVAGLPGDAFDAPRPGFFGSISATLNHILSVDLYYLDALEEGGLGRTVFDAPDIAALDDLSSRQADADTRLAMFCRRLTPGRLAAKVVTDRPSGPQPEETAALLLHLFQHQVHHRGQAHVMLSHAGVAPPQLDDFFLEYGRVPSAQEYWS